MLPVSYHDVTSGTHQDRVNELSVKGYRPVVLNVSGDPGDPRYAAVWVQRPGPAWRAMHGVREQDYQTRFNENVAQGYGPVIVTATGPPGRAIFAAVFATGQPRGFARHGLRWGALNDPATLTNSMGRAFDEGMVPRSIAVYGTAQDPLFAGVWTENTGTLWAWYWGNDDFHQRTFDAQLLGGQHPSQVAVGSGMLLSVFIDDHLGRWSARHGMTAPDYRLAVDAAGVDGLRPIAVQAGDLGPRTRYAATFAADDLPFPRRWRVDGRPIPGQDDLDAVFSDVMHRLGVRAASVAVARNGKAYLTRAYTWAEDDWPTTRTSTTFRIASVSKAFTCAAVQSLADRGVIDLDARVFAYLGLASNVPHDPRAETITIRHCATEQSGLPHDFGKDVTFRDIGVALGHQASVRELAAHIYRLPLLFDPGNRPPGIPDDGYSNSAFHVLGAVVEQASGQRLVDFVNQRIANPMGIGDLRAGATGPGLRHPGEVVGYDNAGVGPSQLDLAPTAIAPDAYGGSGLLLETTPGTGGMVTSAKSIARFLGTHAVWDLGGRVEGTRYGDFAGTAAAGVSNGVWDFSFMLNRAASGPVKNEIRAGIFAYLAKHGSSLSPAGADERFPIRGVLLAGGIRTQTELNAMSHDDMRNTLIVELTNHSNQTDYQAFDDDALAGMGAVMVFLSKTGVRDAAALRKMSADDQRNTLIVEIDGQTGVGGGLQALTNMELVLVALGSDRAVRGQVPGVVSSWIRGVLLVGGFRTQRELNAMSHDDMRNTLIVELANHSNQTDFQAFHDADLEGMGAVMVVLRALRIRDDATLRTMSADDQRNLLIVVLDEQTHLGLSLQALSNLDLVLTALVGTPP